MNSHFNHLKHPDGQSTGLLKTQPGFPVSDPKQSSEVYSYSGQGLNHDLNRNPAFKDVREQNIESVAS